MEWTTVQHLDLRHVGRGLKPLQPHAAVFHPTQAIVAVAIGIYVIEFDALTGCKISSIKIGARVVQMQYIPNGAHAIVSVLEDSTIRSCDFDSEQTLVLHSPEKKSELVGTVEGGRPPTKIKTDLKKPIVNLYCHPRLPVLLTNQWFKDMAESENLKNRTAYTREGRKQLFSVLQSAKGSSGIVPIVHRFCCSCSFDFERETSSIRFFWNLSRTSTPDTSSRAPLERHFMEGHAQSGPVSRLPILAVLDVNHQLRDAPVCKPLHLELNFFNRENHVLQYPVRAFYMDNFNLMAHSLSSGTDNIYKKLYSSIPGHIECLPVNMLYSPKQHLFLVVFELSGPSGAIHEVVLYWEQMQVQSVRKGTSIRGRDAAFVGSHENQYIILDDDKTGLSLYTLTGADQQDANLTNLSLDTELQEEKNVATDNGAMQFQFESEVDRIFSFPLDGTVLYAISGKHVGLVKIILEYHLATDNGYIISTKTDGKFMKLQRYETVYQHLTYVNFRSLLWLGPALLFSTATCVGVLGWDGRVRPILSISMPCSVLVGALNDRLLLIRPTETSPKQKNGVEIRSCLVGLLEPLLIGFSTMQQHFQQKIDLPEVLYQITSRFDSLRITPRSLDILANGSPVCGDLALSLSQAGPQFTQVLRCTYAIKALRFSTALSVLKDEYMRSRYYPQCPPTSHLFHRFQQLAHSCIMYGQFDSAKETYEIISDFESMLDLFICHLNPTAMRRLAEMLEDAATDSELRRYSERILIVRSTGWSQAGAFDNFAAESMVPKGPEWGGGNWEIKTPVNMKNIPQWELAGEVMPYMKTDDGGIPSIIADHIGVYLGAVKGRGNVVEVNEKSLVKAFTATSHENNGLAASAPISIQTYTGMTDDLKVGSLKENNGKQLSGGVASGGEQEKAEEEFKRSLYGVVDGSSSDEDEASSKIKIHIKIRDKTVSGSAVDVNKLKEATKQFKIGDAPMRTRSISSRGSRDISLVLPMPAPAMTTAATTSIASSASDMFKPDGSTSSMQTRTILGGMGVAAGPIPENFFENTISAVNVAASLVIPRTYLSKLDQSSQGTEDEKIPPKQNCPSNIDPYDVGMLPQLPQQRGIPLERVGLPDSAIPTHVQVYSPQIPTSQAVDRSSLETHNPNAMKSPPCPPSAPSVVPPGQVPHGAPASICFKTGLAHLEQNQLLDALSCFDESFLALAKDQSNGTDVKAQATICAQYNIAVAILQEIARLQKVQGPSAISAKEEMARLSRHLGSLPLLAKHRINCIRTAIKRNIEVQNFGYAKQMLHLLLSKAPPSKQEELHSLINMCMQRGLSNKSIDPQEEPSQFCAATLSRLSTIGHDVCDLCSSKFSALSAPGCIVWHGQHQEIRCNSSSSCTFTVWMMLFLYLL
ncbi:hypothetical protein HPP92_008982 [Vanilla planifolia]|uniref:Uncharacterized protein n=1 Tax=Vanilla planifolia TaxID=51239 RepID=A0A835R722_VANPL|nr:hypothetical protein HPP92_008982 [Vanilla planifolia]